MTDFPLTKVHCPEFVLQPLHSGSDCHQSFCSCLQYGSWHVVLDLCQSCILDRTQHTHFLLHALPRSLSLVLLDPHSINTIVERIVENQIGCRPINQKKKIINEWMDGWMKILPLPSENLFCLSEHHPLCYWLHYWQMTRLPLTRCSTFPLQPLQSVSK